MRTRYVYSILIYGVLFVTSVMFLYPIVIMITNSFMSAFEITNRYTFKFNAVNGFDADSDLHFVEMDIIPNWVTIKQYIRFLFEKPLYLGLLLNSVKITVPIVIGQILIAVPAAYAFEAGKIRFKEVLFFVYIVIMLLPLQVTLVPNYIMADFLNMEGSYLAIILPAIFSPFGVFLVRQFLKGMPPEYVEAAKIDGAAHLQLFAYIIIPIIKPAIAALAILTFVEYWNIVDQAVIFVKESVDEPLSVYLARLMNEQDMNMIFAASCFYMLPAVLIFLFGQEYMVEGIQLSGIK